MRSVVKIGNLFTAAANGDVKELEDLLLQGARINDTNSEGYTALQVAAKKGKDDCVTFLLQEGANVNQRDSDGFSALHEAAFFGYDNIARILLSYGIDKTFKNLVLQHWIWLYAMATGLLCTCLQKAIPPIKDFIRK
ncbi:putative ankyrin repeat-containing domain-containing protein [Plasmopara halstedii]